MIGVLARPSDIPIVREFFELFKTPWEFFRSERRYDVLLCAGDHEIPEDAATLVVIYAGREVAFDVREQIQTVTSRKSVAYKRKCIPLYGESVTFSAGQRDKILFQDESHPILSVRKGPLAVTRIGYDLFNEIRKLLTSGQPYCDAEIPTLEMHIALLREVIAASGIQLVEIPPVPEGYSFIACLTHDIDHPSIRLHKFDHTILGFLYRCLAGSSMALVRHRISWRAFLTNWAAVLKLPLVHLGFARDFWRCTDRYRNLEGGLPSTYFVIPFSDRPGKTELGQAPRRRKSRYGARDISSLITELTEFGCEIGLHGIDAWIDEDAGREELEEIRPFKKQNIGARMHWLYFNERSPVILERAGVAYDSTVGYCSTVGYRAGATQVYKPVGTDKLLELPLHVMDTALFFPCYLNLSPRQAQQKLSAMIDNAIEYGGCLTINWHDRSTAPDRLWTDTYLNLIAELKSKGAWFATAANTVGWFAKRRSFSFEHANSISSEALQQILAGSGDLPPLQLRVPDLAVVTSADQKPLYAD